MDSRHCVRCGVTKPTTEFYTSMPRCSICIACIRIAQARRNHARTEREKHEREYAKAAIAGKLPA